jgi:hypothetical protein
MSTTDRILSKQLRKIAGESIFAKLEVRIRKDQLNMDLLYRLRNPLGTSDPRYVIQRSFMCVSFSESQHGKSFLEMIRPDSASFVLKAAKEDQITEGTYLVKIPRWQIMLLSKYVEEKNVKSKGIEVLVNEVLCRCAKSLEIVMNDE